MSNSWNQSVRRCRAVVFGRLFASNVTASGKGAELNDWLNENWNREKRWDDPVAKSGRLLKGTFPQKELRQFVIERFPRFKRFLSSPIWLSLSQLSVDQYDNRFWNSCASAIEINGVSLSRHKSKVMESFAGTGWDWWDRLGLLLMILRSDDMNFSVHREWIKSNFFAYMCIVFISYPARWVVPRLFGLIDEMVRTGVLGDNPFYYWPSSLDELNYELECYQYAFDKIVLQRWWWRCKGGEDPSLLLWLLTEERDALQDLCDDVDKNYRISAQLRMKWLRALRVARETNIEFRLEKVGVRGIPAADKRVVCRFYLEKDW
ncbi:hypothetical protein [Pseudomonas pseudonitroreducens]|uniref:hypothetical protein n=1 Tax=Pseudomonas pseudonitroreducens TaxID=2892326 RepID=UPI001F2F6A97|nr:hypothetical protein [Pseudomonas pseudonitroreducens]